MTEAPKTRSQFIAKNFILEYDDTLEIDVQPALDDLVIITLRVKKGIDK